MRQAPSQYGSRASQYVRQKGPPVSDTIESFLASSLDETPYLVVDLEVVTTKYAELQRALPGVSIHYAVKANPLPDILSTLRRAGSSFDIASPVELDLCLATGVDPAQLSFGNTVKKASAIRYAHAAGVTLFSVDCVSELEKVAENAPGARVMARLRTMSRGAEWPLSRKFGCDEEPALDLLIGATRLGLVPYGVSFHVGSQQTDPSQWSDPIARAARLYSRLRKQGVELQCLNIGGGFPAQYIEVLPAIEEYGRAVQRSLRCHFGTRGPRIMAEPGRFLVAEAGVIQSEVVLVSRRSKADGPRWVYLDCGRFGGLAETMNEAIKYPLRTHHATDSNSPVVLAGPTCDSADILYERTMYSLPDDLRAGDRVQILSAGAYTHMYASVGFNGFPPLKATCV